MKTFNDYILRIGKNSPRFSRGTVYMLENYCVVDDRGSIFQVSLNHADLWVSLGIHQNYYKAAEYARRHHMPEAGAVPYRGGYKQKTVPEANHTADAISNAISNYAVNLSKEFNQEYNKMSLEIKTVTYVNNSDVTKLSVDDYLQYIREERNAIESLEDLAKYAQSKAVTKRVQEHKLNIERLIEFMDSL